MPDPLSLIASPRRAAIVKMVWREERSAGDIARAFTITFGAISQQLSKLVDGGVLARRVDGRQVYYRANREALGPLAAALEEMWFGKLATLKDLAEAEQRRIDATKPKSRRTAPRSAKHAKQSPAANQRKQRKDRPS